MSKVEIKKLLYFLAAVACGLLIFYLSSQANLKSQLPPLYDLIFRKIAHVGIFASLAWLVAKSFNKKDPAYLIFVITVGIYYAFTDELHQLRVPGRHGSPFDIVIDAVGVGIGVYLFLHPPKFFKKISK